MKRIQTVLLILMLSAVFAACTENASTADINTDAHETAETIKSEAENIQLSVNTEASKPKTVNPKHTDGIPYDLPTLYIDLDNNVKQDNISHDEYITAVLELEGNGFCDDVAETAMSIKGRGNYSWSFPKKPYNIKFDTKIDLGGMGAAKKWTLVTTYSDKTMTRNYITLNLAKDIGMDCGMDCIMVNLVVNGEFRGLYLLTERVQIQENRIDISKETGRLFEIEMKYRHSDCSLCIQTQNGVHIMLVEPEEEDVGKDKIASILSETKRFFNSAEEAMSGTAEEYSKYIDAESFAQWYIVNELCKNYDSIFVTSCYCYINDDGKLAMGSPWDYDTCYGNQIVDTCVNPEGWYIANAVWYKLLFKSADFNKLVSELWNQVRKDGTIDNITKRIDTFVKEKSESIEANNKCWPNTLKMTELRGGMSLYTFKEEVDYLKNWLAVRIAWLDEMITDEGINRDTNKYGDKDTQNIIKKYTPLSELVDIKKVKSTEEGYSNEGVENLFDLDENTKYCWLPVNGSTTTVTFNTTKSVKVCAYAIKTANDTFDFSTRNPDSWTLWGSTDGKTWTKIAYEADGDGKMSTENYTYTAFELKKPVTYKYFKLEIKDSDCMQMSEFTLLGESE